MIYNFGNFYTHEIYAIPIPIGFISIPIPIMSCTAVPMGMGFPWGFPLPRTPLLESDGVAINRLNRGLTIRRVKKRSNLINDGRLKASMSRYDSLSRMIGAHIDTCTIPDRAVSRSVGAQDVSDYGQTSDADDDGRSAGD